MNTRRIFFWSAFVVILGLIVWGLVVAMNKAPSDKTAKLGQPAPVTGQDHVWGPTDAPVTIIEYSDFQCPACQAYYYVLEKLMASSTVPIRLVYRHFPLTQHKNALPAAMASEAASVQGKFWEMYGLIFDNAADWTEADDPNPVFVGYATKIGLDAEKFKTDLSSATLKEFIKSQNEEGLKIGINSTPTFFVNGKVITNPTSYAAFQALIEEAASGNTQ